MKTTGIIILILTLMLLVLCAIVGDIPEVIVKFFTIIWMIEAMKKL